MLNTPRLNEKQVLDFEDNGYLIVRDAFGSRDIKLLKSWSEELSARPEEPGKHWVYHEKSKLDANIDLINRIENISPFHSGFAELSEVLKAPTAQLLGEDAVLFKEKINFKMPGGEGFKPHQDSQAGWQDYADYFISVMVTIDAATVQNGCLQLVAGHHHRGLFRMWEPLTGSDMKDMKFVPHPTRPGDLVFFDCYTPHASEANMSNQIRRLYFATYNRLSDGDHKARYYADKRKSFPPDIERIPGKEYVFRV